jgi:hypothetical protein
MADNMGMLQGKTWDDVSFVFKIISNSCKLLEIIPILEQGELRIIGKIISQGEYRISVARYIIIFPC